MPAFAGRTLPGTNLLDEWIAEVVESHLATFTPTGRQYIENWFHGNPHHPVPDARASAVTARAPAQVAAAP